MPKKLLLSTALTLTLLLIISTAGGAGAAQSDADAARAAGSQTEQTRPGGGEWVKARTNPGRRREPAEFVPGEVLVKLRDRAKADALPRSQKTGLGVLSSPTARLDKVFQRFDVTEARQPFSRARSDALRRVVKLTSRNLKGDRRATEEMVKALRADPEVEYAEPNYLLRKQWAPNDPYFASAGSWGQDFRDLWGLEKIGAEAAWGLTRGAGAVVAVIDSGVDYGHEDIAQNVWENPGEKGFDGSGRDKRSNGVDDEGNGFIDDWRGWDFVTSDGSPTDNDPMDDEGHGTHVAGTVAAVGNNRLGIVGVAPESKVMALKGLDATGSGSLEDLTAAIVYAADNGAGVINASWGMYSPEPVRSLADAIAYAREQDVLFVTAAGNEAWDVGSPADGFTPANILGAFAVSAFNHEDALAPFSNYGRKIEVAAPGGGDNAPAGAVNDPWRSVLSLASSQGAGIRGIPHLVVGGRYLRLAGTSMAAPHAAGVAALVRSLHPEFSAEQVRQTLRAGSDDMGAAGFDEQSGYGRVNAARALAVGSPVGVRLTSPSETLTDVTQADIRGTVAGAGLAGWRLEYRNMKAAADAWTLIRSSAAAVSDATLATWDLTTVSDGAYELRVVATNTAGHAFEDRLSVLVDNVYITDPPPHWPKIYRDDPALPITGAVSPVNLSGYSFSVGRTLGFALENPRITLANGGTQKVRDGLLATWDTTDVPAGSYVLTLNVSLTNGDTISERVTVLIEPAIHEGSPKSLPNIVNGIFAYAFVDHLIAADVNGDGAKELVTGYGGTVSVYDHAGRMLPGWPQTVDPEGTGQKVQRSPAVGDLDGDGSPELVIQAGPHVFAWRADGSPLPGWPKTFGYDGKRYYFGIADLNNDGDNELVLVGSTLRVVDKDGASLPGWPVDLSWKETTFVDFVICDLEADGQKEVVARANNSASNATDLYVFNARGELKPGWPRTVDYLSPLPTSPHPAAGDLDGDGDHEIVVVAADGRVHAYRHDGSVAPGWPQQTLGGAVNSPAVGDLDGDGKAEVVAGIETVVQGYNTYNYLYAWRGDGTLLPGWPVKREGPFGHLAYGFGPPVLADVDGDGAVDVVASGDLSIDHEVLFAYRLDGSHAAGFPKRGTAPGASGTTSPAIADLDGDGRLELAWVDLDMLLYIWDLPSAANAPAPWPMYRHDEALTGAFYAPGFKQRQFLQLGSANYVAAEGAGGIQFTVKRGGGARGAVSVSYATSDGMASAGQDYTAASGVVTFADGDATAKTITVPVANDALDEYDEMFTVSLSAPTGGAELGPQNKAMLMITDDEPLPSMAVGDATVTEGDGGVTTASFEVTLSAPSGRTVTVQYATADGTASAGGDYTAASGILYFAPGQRSETVRVNVKGDALFEPDETFFLNLSSPAQADLTDGQAQARVTNDDPAPTYTISGQVTDAANRQPLPGVTVTLSGSRSASATTDPSGAYSFEGLAAGGALTVTAAKANYTFAPASASFSNLGANQTAAFSAAVNRHTVSGRVTTAGGAALAEVVLTLSGSQSGTARSDASGAYSFGSLPAGGSYTVTPSKTHYAFDRTGISFDNLGGDRVADFAAVRRQHSIRGRVSKPGGLPLPGLTVTLGGAQNSSATTDAAGGYSFAGLGAGLDYTVAVADTAYYTFAGSKVEALGADTAVDFTGTPRTYTVSGRVKDASGAVLAGVAVRLGGSSAGESATDADGRYVFHVTAGGSYTLSASKTHYDFTPAVARFEALSADQARDFEAVLRKYSLVGRITLGGAALPGVTVTLGGSRSGSVTTGGDGAYVFRDIYAGGSYTVSAAMQGYTFAPAAQSFNDLGGDRAADFAATALPTPTPTPVPTPIPTPIPTDSPTPTPTPTPVPTTTPTPESAPTPSPTPIPQPIDIGNSADFVRQNYLDFLNREPDTSGLNFWTGEIEGCGADARCREVKRINVSAAFFLSIEFQQTGYMAYRAHKVAFGNLPGKPVPLSREQMLEDVRLVGSGVVVGGLNWERNLEANKESYFNRLAASERFTARYPQSMTPEQYVAALNSNAGGVLSPAGRDALVAELGAGSKTRAQALRAVAEDEGLAKSEFNKAFVLMQFFGYLRRNPDAAPDSDFSGYDFWLGKLNEFNGDYIAAEMVRAFIESNEYRGRFGR